jgi:hypothetical protein
MEGRGRTRIRSPPLPAAFLSARLLGSPVWLASWHRRWHSAIELFRKASKVIRNRGGYWQVKVYAGLDPLTGKQRFERRTRLLPHCGSESAFSGSTLPPSLVISEQTIRRWTDKSL